MSWIGLVVRLIPTVIKLMSVAEELFDDVPESGEQKKELVLAAVKAIVEGLSGVTLTPEMWVKIESALSALIDLACAILFPKKG